MQNAGGTVELMQGMTAHRRFLASMRFQPVDRHPLQELPAWDMTIKGWGDETGLGKDAVVSWLEECDAEENAGVRYDMIPPFEERIVSEDEETFVKTDSMGLTYRQFKDNYDRSMPEYLSHPVKTLQDWKEVRRRFDPASGRYPENWRELVSRWKSDEPIVRLYGWVKTYFGGPSLYGFVRMLLGDERAGYAFYDEPMLIHDMMETMTEFTIAVFRKALEEAPVTLAQFWEDMCYRNGPLISPRMFKEFMLPRYRRMTEVIRGAGVDIIFLDSDGNVEELLPLWLDAGINGLFPMEVAAGNDIRAYRKRYGKNLLMSGGIDKRALAKGRKAIDSELERTIPLAFEGGYIPTLDHAIPPDVGYEDFLYYWERKKRLLGISEVGKNIHRFTWYKHESSDAPR